MARLTVNAVTGLFTLLSLSWLGIRLGWNLGQSNRNCTGDVPSFYISTSTSIISLYRYIDHKRVGLWIQTIRYQVTLSQQHRNRHPLCPHTTTTQARPSAFNTDAFISLLYTIHPNHSSDQNGESLATENICVKGVRKLMTLGDRYETDSTSQTAPLDS